MANQRTRQGPARTLRWDLSTIALGALTVGNPVAATIVVAGAITETLMRMRGSVEAHLTSTIALGDAVHVGVGVIKAQSGQGTTVFSSPLSDGEAPWIWVDYFTLVSEDASASSVDGTDMKHIRHEIDSKAMRILRPDIELQIVGETVDVNGAPAVDIFSIIRFLFAH